MKKYFLPLVLLSVMLLNFNCKKTLTGPDSPFALTVEDVSCTEAWVKITNTNFQNPSSLTLYVDDKPNQNITLVSSDTLLYVDSLLPNQSYKIKAAFVTNNQPQTTNEVVATTMDTTSHNFTWQTFTFGEYDNSVLNDVAIINENNIWAVGEIYMNDSLGNPDPEQYAVAHWNGLKWELMKLKTNCRLYYPNCGPITMLISSGYSIFARRENDIWIAAGSVHHFDGNNWTEEAGIIGAGGAHKIWGNSNELWFVGSGGFIAHRNPNGSWQRIESGTDLHVYDIWGDFNTKTKEYEILAVASHVLEGSEKKIFQIKGTTAIAISAYPIGYSLTSVWFIPNKHYYVVGSGIYEKITLSNNEWKNRPLDITRYATDRIRGNGINDIFAVGAFGEVLHYNGITWKSYINSGTGINGDYSGLALKNNFLVIVGYVDRKACITIGKR